MTADTEATVPADDTAGTLETTDNTSDEQLWDEIDAEDDAGPSEDDGSADDEGDDGDDEQGEGDEDEAGDLGDEDGGDGGEETGADGGDDGEEAQPPTLEELKQASELHLQQFKSEQKRSMAQQKRADRLQKELNRITSRPAADKDKDDQRKQKLSELSEEYADVVGPLVEEVDVLNSRLESQTESDAIRADAIKEELGDLRQAETLKLTEAHPDYAAFMSEHTAVFDEWIEDQPKIVRDAYSVNENNFVDGSAAAFLVSKFKEAIAGSSQATPKPTTSTLEKRRQHQLAGARGEKASTNQKATSDNVPEDGDWDQTWDALDAKEARKR